MHQKGKIRPRRADELEPGRQTAGALSRPPVRHSPGPPWAWQVGGARAAFSLQLTKNKGAFSKVFRVHGPEPSCDYSARLFLSVQINNSLFAQRETQKASCPQSLVPRAAERWCQTREGPRMTHPQLGEGTHITVFSFSTLAPLFVPMRQATS